MKNDYIFLTLHAEFWKTNTLLNSIKVQNDIDKISLYAKDLNEPKYKLLIKKHKDFGTNHFNYPNAFIYWVFNYTGWRLPEYWWQEPKQKRKKFNCFWWYDCRFYEQQKFQAIMKHFFVRCRKLNISLAFITQSYYPVPKDVRLNSTHFLIMKISSKQYLQSITINSSKDLDYNDFVKIYRKCTRESYSFLTIDTTLPACDPLKFRKISSSKIFFL